MTYQEVLLWIEEMSPEASTALGGPYTYPRIELARAIQTLVQEQREEVARDVWNEVAPAATYAKFSTGELRREVENTRKVLEKICGREGVDA